MVYVDTLARVTGRTVQRISNWKRSCHLFADSVWELNKFALSIGLKREWLQTGFPHYDLTASMRKRAVDAGAKEVSRKYTAIRRLAYMKNQ